MSQNRLSHIHVVIPSDQIASHLVSSGALSGLLANYKVTFIAPNQDISTAAEYTLYSQPSFYYSPLLVRLNNLIWLTELFAYLRRKSWKVSDNFKYQQLNLRWKALTRILSRRLFIWIIKLIDNCLFAHDSNYTKIITASKPDLVVLPLSALDTYTFIIGRTCKRYSIPTLGIVMHWDFFTKKSILRFMPDRFYIWGSDMLEYVDQEIIMRSRVVGSPQLDIYSQCRQSMRRTAPDKVLKILYAAPSMPFDDLSLLNRLDECITCSNRQVHIIYRPHPRAHPRKTNAVTPLEDLRHVYLESEANSSPHDTCKATNILQNIDALISPWSTMVLEASLLGKPCQCVAFNDHVNQWDWDNQHHAEHAYQIDRKRVLLHTKRSSSFESDFLRLLELVNQPDYSERIFHCASQAVFTSPSQTYSERLLRSIKSDFFPPTSD